MDQAAAMKGGKAAKGAIKNAQENLWMPLHSFLSSFLKYKEDHEPKATGHISCRCIKGKAHFSKANVGQSACKKATRHVRAAKCP